MGCVRDCVPIKLFTHNIVKFHQATGALVTIVAFNDKSGTQRRGFSFHEFVKQLGAKICEAVQVSNRIQEETILDVKSGQLGILTPIKRPGALQSLDEYPTLQSGLVSETVVNEKQSNSVVLDVSGDRLIKNDGFLV